MEDKNDETKTNNLKDMSQKLNDSRIHNDRIINESLNILKNKIIASKINQKESMT